MEHIRNRPEKESTMPDFKRISAELSDQDITELRALVVAARSKLPFLRNLTTQERKELAKLGDKTVGFDEKVQAYMVTNPEFVPGFIDTAEVHKDRLLRTRFMGFLSEFMTLAEHMDDTMTILGSEILMADLAYYQSVREAAKRGVPGAQQIYDDLRTRFPGGGGRTAASATA